MKNKLLFSPRLSKVLELLGNNSYLHFTWTETWHLLRDQLSPAGGRVRCGLTVQNTKRAVALLPNKYGYKESRYTFSKNIHEHAESYKSLRMSVVVVVCSFHFLKISNHKLFFRFLKICLIFQFDTSVWWSNLTGYGLNDGFVLGCFPVASLVPWDSNSIFIQDFVFVFFFWCD